MFYYLYSKCNFKELMTKKINLKRISLDVPDYIIEQIDKFCEESFITRRKWFIDAASDKIEKDKLNKIDMVVRK